MTFIACMLLKNTQEIIYSLPLRHVQFLRESEYSQKIQIFVSVFFLGLIVCVITTSTTAIKNML